MKCCFCNGDGELLMTNGKSICHNCAEKKNLVICTKTGKVVADFNFHCDNICNDCIYTEDEIK